MTAAQIRAQQAERFQRYNGFTDEQVRQLSDYCRGRSDYDPMKGGDDGALAND